MTNQGVPPSSGEPEPDATARLRRFARRWTGALAEVAATADFARLAAVEAEIRQYVLALSRHQSCPGRIDAHSDLPERDSLEHPPLPCPPLPAQARDAAPEPQSATLTPRRSPDPDSPAQSGERPPADLARRTLARFCQLTGIDPADLRGRGSHLAGILFYFAVFARLTGGRELPHEAEQALLRRLRECREAMHELVREGWTARPAAPFPAVRQK